MKELIEEIWRPVKDYEGLYEVSNLGRVRGVDRVVLSKNGKKRFYKGQTKKQKKDKDGYLTVDLSNNGKHKTKKVHRLVAQAFIPNPDNLPIINHKDENPSNNRYDNLEWCTNEYNLNYGTRNKRISEKQINNVKKSKQVFQYTLDGELVAIWPSTHEAGRNGYHRNHISECCSGKQHCKTHKGYIWSYNEIKNEDD